MSRGELIIVEGPDLSGKDTLLEAFLQAARDDGKNVFDVKQFWLKERRHPFLDEIAQEDPFLVSYSEPSYVGIGLDLRQNVLPDPQASIGITAQAFAKDRYEMLTNLINPLRQAGYHCISSRNFLSSLFYQPLQARLREDNSEYVTFESVRDIPENQAAMLPENLPSHMIICTAPGQTLVDRRDARTEKQDNSQTETDRFLHTIAQDYETSAGQLCKTLGIPNITERSLTYSVEMTRYFGEELYKQIFKK